MALALIQEVMDRAPADITPAEYVVLLAVAERAYGHTRLAYATTDNPWDLAERARLSPTGLRTVLQRLAKRGLEVRVQLTTKKHPGGVFDTAGRPVYACRGRASTYRLPELPPCNGDASTSPLRKEADASASPFDEKGDVSASHGDVSASPLRPNGDASASPLNRERNREEKPDTRREPATIADWAVEDEPPPESLDEDSTGASGPSAEVSDPEPHLPPKPTANISTRCPRHRGTTDDLPCRACGDARRAAEGLQARAQAALVAWERDYEKPWEAWRKRQPECDDRLPGGGIPHPLTGVIRCPGCRNRAKAQARKEQT